jgi:pimeloyl-ACP methyl ester carboxylesterase
MGVMTTLPSPVLGTPKFVVLPRGNQIRYFDSGNQGKDTVLFVHGGGAHSGWWLEVAPFIAAQFRALAVDLSGHGESDHCENYQPELWAAELGHVLDHAGVETAHLVGHSMGGRVCIFFASRWPSRTSSLTLIDTPLQHPQGAISRGRPRGKEKRTYATEEEAVADFKLRPGDSVADKSLLREVARRSVVQTAVGWTWRFDPDATQRFTDEALEAELRNIRCDLTMIRGEQSPLVALETIRYVDGVMSNRVRDICIPAAYHHVPLDNPVACRQAISTAINASSAPT